MKQYNRTYGTASAEPNSFELCRVETEEDKVFEILCKIDFCYLSTEVIGGFTSVMLGIYARGVTDKQGYADFDWFEYVTR